MLKPLTSLIFLLLSSLVIFSCGPAPKKEAVFMPANNLPTGIDGQTLVTEQDFYDVIDLADELYAPIIAGIGGVLTINALWDDPTVNASATQDDDGYWIVNMYGGLARRPEVTVDGFIVVLCHELGHHLAGFPFVSSWAANEGQSDYFATQVCLRKMFKASDNRVVNVPAIPQNLCRQKYSDAYRINLCIRSLVAGKSTSDLLAALNGETVYYTEQDTSTIKTTDNKHPKAQCRLDTMLAGALCDTPWDDFKIPRAKSESALVSCVRNNQAEGDAITSIQKGLRPRCWYAP